MAKVADAEHLVSKLAEAGTERHVKIVEHDLAVTVGALPPMA